LSRQQWRSNTADCQVLVDALAPRGFPDRLVAKVTLNRPKANAMGSVMAQEWQDCLDMLEETNSKAMQCVVDTSGLGNIFSAGADLKERATMTQDQAADFVTLSRNTMERVPCLAVPVLAEVEGLMAVGGGLQLALAVDLPIASATATFGFQETSGLSCRSPRTHADCRGLMQITADLNGLPRT
jgi:enoyl-CoA hydratase/carnithine racemase